MVDCGVSDLVGFHEARDILGLGFEPLCALLAVGEFCLGRVCAFGFYGGGIAVILAQAGELAHGFGFAQGGAEHAEEHDDEREEQESAFVELAGEGGDF